MSGWLWTSIWWTLVDIPVTRQEPQMRPSQDKRTDASRRKARKNTHTSHTHSLTSHTHSHAIASCFKVTPRTVWAEAKVVILINNYVCKGSFQKFQKQGLPTHYFPGFYGHFLGPYVHHDNGSLGTSTNSTGEDFQLVYQSSTTHKSLVTLLFTADSISFVDNR